MVEHDEFIRFQECNPKRRRTAAWERYDKYKVATIVGYALKLGATIVYIAYDSKHCFAMRRTGRNHPHEAPPMRLLKHHAKQPLTSAIRLQQVTSVCPGRLMGLPWHRCMQPLATIMSFLQHFAKKGPFAR